MRLPTPRDYARTHERISTHPIRKNRILPGQLVEGIPVPSINLGHSPSRLTPLVRSAGRITPTDLDERPGDRKHCANGARHPRSLADHRWCDLGWECESRRRERTISRRSNLCSRHATHRIRNYIVRRSRCPAHFDRSRDTPQIEQQKNPSERSEEVGEIFQHLSRSQSQV